MAGRTGERLDFSWVRTEADIGAAISQLRQTHPTQPTLQSMANRAGVQAPTTISNWMNGLLPQDEDKLDRLLIGLSAFPEEREQILATFRVLDEQRRKRRQESAPIRRAAADQDVPAVAAATVVRSKRRLPAGAVAVAAVAAAAVIAVLVTIPREDPHPGTAIIGRSSMMCLRPSQDSAEPDIRQYLCTRDLVAWQLREISAPSARPSSYRIVNETSQQCLSGSDRLIGDAFAVVQRGCLDDDPGQVWILDATETANGWTYGNLRNGHVDRCLDINKNSKTEGGAAVLWPCSADLNQQFGIELQPAAPRTGSGPRHRQVARPGGANPFLNQYKLIGLGSKIEPGQEIDVQCKIFAPVKGSPSIDPGYWYVLPDPPWSGRYFVPATSFRNGGPLEGPGVVRVDMQVPDC